MYYIFILLQIGAGLAIERKFPEDFMFGVSTSAYQIEGAWNESGKGEGLWDQFTHEQPQATWGGANGDIACDSYHKIKEDVQLLKHLGVHFYRFTLSWPRVLPTGYRNKINSDGIRYYNELIDELIKNDIIPMVSLMHFDIPTALLYHGGPSNPLFAKYFLDYARLAFESFGDRVKYWITINEPLQVCRTSRIYNNSPMTAKGNYFCIFDCFYAMMLAHAAVYHLYDKEFRPTQKGKISIAADTYWFEPYSNSSEDIRAAELALQANFGLATHAIYSSEGDFPAIVKEALSNTAEAKLLGHSILHTLTKDEIDYIRGSADFLALVHYSTYLARFSQQHSTDKLLIFTHEFNISVEHDPSWKKTPLPGNVVVPWGFRKLLNFIKKEYNNTDVFIVENGIADLKEVLNDRERYDYMKSYLDALLDAISDGCNVKGYSVWSLMDNFEWIYGYATKYGLYHVDFNEPNRTRTPKSSAFYYKKVIKTKTINHEFQEIEELHSTPEEHTSSLPNTLIYILSILTIIALRSLFNHK